MLNRLRHPGAPYFSLLKNIVIFVFRSLSLSSNILVPSASLSRISFKETLCKEFYCLKAQFVPGINLSKTNGMFSEKPHSYSFSSCFLSKEIKLEK